MLKRKFLLLFWLVATGTVMAQAYRWVDDNGVVHYSDTPIEGAERVELPHSSPRPRRTSTPRPGPVTRQDTSEQAEPATPFRYETLIISAPAAEETLWNIEGTLDVNLDLRPALKQGHQVRIYFDGDPRMVSGSSFQLEEVYRGTHNLQAEVVDETGRLMIRSLPNRFYVHQTAIGQ